MNSEKKINLALEIIKLVDSIVDFTLDKDVEMSHRENIPEDFGQQVNDKIQLLNKELIEMCSGDKSIALGYLTLAKSIIEEKYEGAENFKKYLQIEEDKSKLVKRIDSILSEIGNAKFAT